MARDIRTKAHLQGGEIRTKANFGQTVSITVLPDPYEGQTTVTPSDERQTLPTRGKTVATDITVLPSPVESLATSENGTFVPSSGNVGFSEVVVDVEPSLESLSVTENGLYLPESGVDGFDRVNVDVPVPSGSIEITENGTYNVEQFASAVVDVPSAEWTTKGIADGSEPYGDLDLGNITKLAEAVFQGRTGITSIIGKLVTTVSSAAFGKCTGLKDVHLPRMTDVSQSCFQGCTDIRFLFLPSVRGISTYGFSGCTSLETLIFVDCTNLGRYVSVATNGDENLKIIVLGKNSVVRSSIGFFSGSPFASGGSGGDIYIPKALYDHLGDGTNQDYLSYAEWNTLNGYGTITWHPIEGSEYETYMPGGAKYEEEMALT